MSKECSYVVNLLPLVSVILAVMIFAAAICPAQNTTQTASKPSSRPTEGAASRPAQTPVLAENTIEHKDVAYGGPDAKLNVLDIYSPAKASKSPVLIFVHGGEWTKGDKREISCKPKFFNEHAIVFVSVNYRLSPKDKHPAQVDDVATAIAWVREHIAEYGGDPNKIVLMGHSAGCHLATLTALNPESLAKVKLKPSDLRGVVAWSGGMYDLVARAKAGGMYLPYIQATFGDSEESQRAASPMTYTQNAKGGPTFLFASTDEERSASSRQAAEAMVEAINKAGGTAKTAILAGKTHFATNHELGADGDKTGLMLLEFITAVTR